jgi:hypothetical protein
MRWHIGWYVVVILHFSPSVIQKQTRSPLHYNFCNLAQQPNHCIACISLSLGWYRLHLAQHLLGGRRRSGRT